MILIKDKFVKNKFLFGGAALVGVAASLYYFLVAKKKT